MNQNKPFLDERLYRAFIQNLAHLKKMYKAMLLWVRANSQNEPLNTQAKLDYS